MSDAKRFTAPTSPSVTRAKRSNSSVSAVSVAPQVFIWSFVRTRDQSVASAAALCDCEFTPGWG